MVIASAKRFASSYTPRGPMGFTWPQYSSCWRDFWVAITLAGRSQEKFRLLRKRKPERVVRAEGAHLESLDGKLQVIHGARGRSKVQNVVHRPWNVDVFRNVAPR